MQRKAACRCLLALSSLACVAVLAGCRPNIPLIPGIKSDTRPAIASEHVAPGPALAERRQPVS